MTFYSMNDFTEVGQIRVQTTDIISMGFIKGNVLVVGQTDGFVDVVRCLEHDHYSVSHALQIEGAGDMNCLSLTKKDGEFLLGTN